MPRNVFFSYSHKDEALRDELEVHLAALRRGGIIHAWHDRRIIAGADWARAIDSNLASARVVLFLVSADFLASDYCLGIEFERAHQNHLEGRTHIVPIILRACDWKLPQLERLKPLPVDGRPVTSWANRDEAWADVAAGIRKVMDYLAEPPPLLRVEAVPIVGVGDAPAPAPNWRSARSQALSDRVSFIARDELDLLKDQMISGYAWVSGIHGIGKSTLVNHIVDLDCFATKRIFHLDGRAQALAYETPLDAMLATFELRSSSDLREKVRTLGQAFARWKNIHIIFDEIDAFPSRSAFPMRQMLFTANVGATIISASAPDFLFAMELDSDNLGSQPPPGSEIELGPLAYTGALEYFGRAGSSPEESRVLAQSSGGNPTLMAILRDMFADSGETDPHDAANRRALQMLHRYFARIWNASRREVRLLLVIGAVSLLCAKTGTAEVFRCLARRVQFGGTALSLFPGEEDKFGYAIVSPLFMAWVISEHLDALREWLEADESTRLRLAGRVDWFEVPDEVWAQAVSAVRPVGDEQEVLRLLAMPSKKRRFKRLWQSGKR